VSIDAPFSDGTGAGLAGMMERTAVLGGTLEAGPRPGGGFRVHAELPTTAAASGQEPGSTKAGPDAEELPGAQRVSQP
jgi:signal transduction histidine kinase